MVLFKGKFGVLFLSATIPVAIATLYLNNVGATGIGKVDGVPKDTVEQKREPGSQSSLSCLIPKGLSVSGPYQSKNLSVFLIHGEDSLHVKPIMPLDEAMKAKTVTVHETGDVNNLSIENLASASVFLQSGDIVKGGNQDRMIKSDLLLPPHSGKIPIEAFCVEQGRWQRRGTEASEVFSSAVLQGATNGTIGAMNSAPPAIQGAINGTIGPQSGELINAPVIQGTTNNSISLQAATNGTNGTIGPGADGFSIDPQSAVWQSVRVAQGKLSKTVGKQVANPLSSTSLQLSLENKEVQEKTAQYVKDLSGIINSRRNVIGFAFTVNSSLDRAEIFGSENLFKTQWPKVLKSAATEAITDQDAKAGKTPVTTAVVENWLRTSGELGTQTITSTKSARINKIDSRTRLVIESQSLAEKGALLHTNFVNKLYTGTAVNSSN